MKTFASVWLLLTVALAGCRTFTAQVEPDRGMAKYQRFFVKTNLSDNHELDAIIANALKAHGREVEQGPLTMMPPTAQVLVTFNDAWNWDFKYHMIAFSLTLSDARMDKPIATADFTGPVAMRTSPREVIDRLVDKLFSTPASKAPGSSNRAASASTPEGQRGQSKENSAARASE